MNISRAFKLFAMIAIAVATVLTQSACTQNDGHIGPLFGMWRLQQIRHDDGSVMLSYDSDSKFVFCFQNDVVCIKKLIGHHETEDFWGSWQRSSDRLILDYTHSDDEALPGEWPYSIPDGIGFPQAPAVIDLTVKQLDGSKMELVLYGDPPEYPLFYSFEKIY